MRPLVFEVRCNLSAESPVWQNINCLMLEIGYLGRGGQTLWKQIGWLSDHLLPPGKGIAHAMWNQTSTELVLIFDFLPVTLPNSTDLDKTYRICKKIMAANGRLRVKKSGILQGEYRDEHFTLSPQYPDIGNREMEIEN